MRTSRAIGHALTATAVLTCVACVGDPLDRCLSEDHDAECLSVLSIVPRDGSNGALTSNVDAFQGLCEVVDPVDPLQTIFVAEPFTDHSADVTIYNSPAFVNRQTPDLSPAVTLEGYEVSFTLNECAPNAICPALDTLFFEGPTVTLLPGQNTTFTIPMMPLRKKFEYEQRGGSAFAFGSYTAHYVMKGRDAMGAVRVEASAEFSVGNYDNCAATF